jgi:hypothetical protein
MHRVHILILLCAALVGGCGALGNRLGPEKLSVAEVPADAAVVILSAGAPENCMQAATFLHIYPADVVFSLRTVITSFNVDGYAVQSDFPTHQGSLSVLQLKPGTYALVPVTASPNVKAVKVPKAEFSIAAGEYLYLGEFWMPRACALQTTMVFRDQEERDMALLKQKNPAFANVKITKRIARFTGYALGGDK